MSESSFDSKAPLVINCSEIVGLEDQVGAFTFKRLNLKGKLTAAVKSSEYKEGKNLSIRFENVAYCLATLETACLNKPETVDFYDLEEETLFDLYDKYDQWVETFRRKLQSKKEGTGQ